MTFTYIYIYIYGTFVTKYCEKCREAIWWMNTGANNDENNVSRYIIVLISKYRYSIAATSILRAYLVSELGAAKRIAIKEDGTVFNDRFIDRI